MCDRRRSRALLIGGIAGLAVITAGTGLMIVGLSGCYSGPVGASGMAMEAHSVSPGYDMSDPLLRMSMANQPATEETDEAVVKAGPDVTLLNADEVAPTVVHNRFERAAVDPISTFSIDVDRASYANVRGYLNGGGIPPAYEVRVEEFINAFDWNYEPPAEAPSAEAPPMRAHVEVGPAPWNEAHQLAKIGLKGYMPPLDNRPSMNLVFLIDVSGSMSGPTRLPLVKESLLMLLQTMGNDDRIGIVTYAGESRVALPSTSTFQRETISDVVRSLKAGGSTHASAGIRDAYHMAAENFIPGGINRVILATDGDFNVGVTNTDDLTDLIAEYAREHDVFLTILGYGTGNYKDDRLEQISNKGNGNYAFIDNIVEASNVLVHGFAGSMITIAKDVKTQVVFNPEQVFAYRLIGYENRLLATEDFLDDEKDAGELGAGHEVTALYEIIPAGGMLPAELPGPNGDTFVWTIASPTSPSVLDDVEAEALREFEADDLMQVRLRWKHPEADTSVGTTFNVPVSTVRTSARDMSSEFRVAAAIALFGQLLRESPYVADSSLDQVIDLIREADQQASLPKGDRRAQQRAELLALVYKARDLMGMNGDRLVE